MRRSSLFVLVLTIIGLSVPACLALAADEALPDPGQLLQLAQPGEYRAAAGDLLVVDLKSNPSTGPHNPAANLRSKLTGDAVRLVTVVFVPPAKPIPGAPGRIQAYFVAEKPGRATLQVTPIQGNRQPGSPLEFQVLVEKR